MIGLSKAYNRIAVEFIPAPGVTKGQIATAACLLALTDETAEGRSIAKLARWKYKVQEPGVGKAGLERLTFPPQTGMSGISANGIPFCRGAFTPILRHIEAQGGRMPEYIRLICTVIPMYGGEPQVVSEGARILGVIHLHQVPDGVE